MSKFSLFLIATLFLSYTISSTTGTECNCTIPLIFETVCGDDNESYPNKMAIKCMNECEGKSVKILNDGPCEGDEWLNDDE